MISGKSTQVTSTETSHLVQSFDERSREEVIKSFKVTITVPPDHVAAMKSTLNLPSDVRRWLKTFKVNSAPEGKSRSVVKEWIGGALHSEEMEEMFGRVKTMVLYFSLGWICSTLFRQFKSDE